MIEFIKKLKNSSDIREKESEDNISKYSDEKLKNSSDIREKELSSRILLDKILDKSESIGRWREFLDKLEDWSNPYVTIAQNHIRDFKKQREEMIREFYNYFD